VPQAEHGVTTVFHHPAQHQDRAAGAAGAGSPIAKFSTAIPDGGIHHVCYEVDDIIAVREPAQGRRRACSARRAQTCVPWQSACSFLHPRRLPSARGRGSNRIARAWTAMARSTSSSGGSCCFGVAWACVPRRSRRCLARHRPRCATNPCLGKKMILTTVVRPS